MSAMIKNFIVFVLFLIGINGQSQTLDWVNPFSATNSEEFRAAVSDQNSNIYITGNFDGTLDLDPSLSTHNIFSHQFGDENILLAKYDSSGNFIWGFDIGDSLDQVAREIQLKSSSEILIGGLIKGQVDFDPSLNIGIAESFTEWNSYIASYTTSGNFNWVKSFQSPERVNYGAFTFDQAGNIYFGLDFLDSVDIDPDTSKIMLYSQNQRSACLVKLNPNGSYLWHHQFGDTGDVYIKDVVIHDNKILVDGRFTKPFDVDPSSNVYSLLGSNSGRSDRYIAEYDTSGNFHWGIWHSQDDLRVSSELIYFGNQLYSLNIIDGTADFVPNDPSGSVSIIDGYGITKFDSGGIYDTTYLIDVSGTYFRAKIIDNSQWLITGTFNGTPDISILGPSFQLNSSTGKGFFVASYNAGFILQNALMVETNNLVFPNDVTADQYGNPVVVGSIVSQADFDPTLDTHYVNTIGNYDAYIAKFGPCISQDTTDTLYICPGDSVLMGGEYRDSSGVYNDTLRAFNSCDSVVAYTLIVYPEQDFSWWGDTIAACDGDSLFFNAGNTVTNSWTWHDGLTSSTWNTVFDHLNPIDSVSVTVGDLFGCSHTGKAVILDNEIDNFGAIVNSPQNPLASFSGVIPAEVDSFYWDFGDGTTLANVAAPTHQYASFGTYEVCLYLFNECGSDSSCKTIEIGPVGITENNQNKEINIYPNPSQDGMFTLETTQKGQLNIFDNQGRLLSIQQVNSPQTTIDLQSEGAGVYLLELQTDESTIRRQLIVE